MVEYVSYNGIPLIGGIFYERRVLLERRFHALCRTSVFYFEMLHARYSASKPFLPGGDDILAGFDDFKNCEYAYFSRTSKA